MLKLNYKVLLMDCIYKTNVYKIHLCIITGITSLNITYYIIFTFLSTKLMDDYCWVLDAIKKLYEFFDILDSKISITDTNPGIICTILEEFPLTYHLLYI